MMKRQADVPLTRDLVLVGGGHAHALVLRAWGMDPLAGARVTVINPGPTAPYTGMLPGHVAGHYGREDLEIDLVHLCRFAGARLILDHAVSVDREARLVRLREGAPVAYDVASVDVGITARMSIAGFDDHAVGAKPLDVFAARWRAYLARVVAGEAAPQVAVIGGGVAGCELAMAMAHALGAAGVVPQVCVIERGPEITGMSARGRGRMQRAMAQMGVALRVNAQVTEVLADRVEITGQAPVDAALSGRVHQGGQGFGCSGRGCPVCRGRLRAYDPCAAPQGRGFRRAGRPCVAEQSARGFGGRVSQAVLAAEELPQADFIGWQIRDGREMGVSGAASGLVAVEGSH